MRAHHGQPAVVFEPTRYRRGYELHGVEARDFYAEQAKGLAAILALKAKLRSQE